MEWGFGWGQSKQRQRIFSRLPFGEKQAQRLFLRVYSLFTISLCPLEQGLSGHEEHALPIHRRLCCQWKAWLMVFQNIYRYKSFSIYLKYKHLMQKTSFRILELDYCITVGSILYKGSLAQGIKYLICWKTETQPKRSVFETCFSQRNFSLNAIA